MPITSPAHRRHELVLEVTRRRARRLLTVAASLLVAAAFVLTVFPSLPRHPARPPHVDLDGIVGAGRGTTRIVIPKLGVDTVVVQGVTAAALRAGVGHYPETPTPCTEGDVAIAGHRTTYERPFSNINLLGPGNVIVLETPSSSCVYRVDRAPFVVAPDDWAVVANTPGRATLTLTACAPKGSAAERLVVKAVMVTDDRRSASASRG